MYSLAGNVMCVTKTTGNDSVIEFSRNAEDTTRGTKLFHQSPINRGRFSDDNIKENSLKHKNNTQQITKTNHGHKVLIRIDSDCTNFIFMFSYSRRAATLTRSLIPLKPLCILSRNMNSVERLVII